MLLTLRLREQLWWELTLGEYRRLLLSTFSKHVIVLEKGAYRYILLTRSRVGERDSRLWYSGGQGPHVLRGSLVACGTVGA